MTIYHRLASAYSTLFVLTIRRREKIVTNRMWFFFIFVYSENNAVCQMTIYFLCFVLSRFAVPEHISNQFWLLCCSQFILCRWWSKMAEWRRKTIRKKSRRTRPLTHTWRKSAHCQLKTISRIPNFWPISFRLVDRPSQHTYTQTSVASISTSLVFRRYACKNTTIV